MFQKTYTIKWGKINIQLLKGSINLNCQYEIHVTVILSFH